MKKLLVIFSLLFCCVGCTESQEKNLINISSSLIPLSSISNYIGDGYVYSNSIIPAGVSPHSFDLKINDAKKIENADLIVYLGLDHIDNFLDKVVGNKNVLNINSEIDLTDINFEDIHDDEIHSHSIDPHVWTSAKNAKIIGKKITDKLIELLPEKELVLLENLLSFENSLNYLIDNFESKVNGKKQNSFIVFHDAYNYLFEELGIDQDKKFVFQKSVISDMNLTDMKNLKDTIISNNIKIIFKEPQFENSNLIRFAEENNLTILDLDPIGVNGNAKGFIENFEKNLRNLERIYE